METPVHVLMFVVIGLIVLGAFYIGARAIWRQGAFGAKHFIWVWFLSSLVNGAAGYFRVGIPLLNEIGAFIPIFGIPAAAAWYLARRA